jgi:rhodanese-related sulfurtransferase
MLTTVSSEKAVEYFDAKLEFTIDPYGLNDLRKSNEVNVIDVRREADYKKGHIPGAINLPKERWSTFEGLTHDKPNVVYCYSISCYLATRACKEFAESGYPVIELIGGFEEWRKSRLPIGK